MTNNRKLTVSGPGTKAAKESLKKAGFRWNADAKHWYLWISSAQASAISGGDLELLKSLGARKKGCRVCIDGTLVWQSTTFVEKSGAEMGGNIHADVDGFGWNVDAAGNPVAGTAIPGSAPDDRI